jgi:hypothetical protein
VLAQDTPEFGCLDSTELVRMVAVGQPMEHAFLLRGCDLVVGTRSSGGDKEEQCPDVGYPRQQRSNCRQLTYGLPAYRCADLEACPESGDRAEPGEGTVEGSRHAPEGVVDAG